MKPGLAGFALRTLFIVDTGVLDDMLDIGSDVVPERLEPLE
jgi:hypothetical protein